jgi:hypothetical protein
VSDSEHARRSGKSKPAQQLDEDPAVLPRGRALFGTERFDSVKREREEASESIARSLKAWRSAKGEATGAPKIPNGGGGKLPDDVRAKMEDKLGADLGGVKVHTGGDSASAADQLGARAFTVGSDVHFGAGQFAPGSKEGDRLLAHELTHVVQGQKGGIQRKAESEAGPAEAPEVSQPHETAEVEADQTADHVAESLHGGADKAHEKAKAPSAAAPNVAAKLWLKKGPKATDEQKDKAEEIKKYAKAKASATKSKWTKYASAASGVLTAAGAVVATQHGLPHEALAAAPVVFSVLKLVANKLGFMKQRHHALEEKAKIFDDVDALLRDPKLIDDLYAELQKSQPDLKELEEMVADARSKLSAHDDKMAKKKKEKKENQAKSKGKKPEQTTAQKVGEKSHDAGDAVEKGEVAVEATEASHALHALAPVLETLGTAATVAAPLLVGVVAACDHMEAKKDAKEYAETKLAQDQAAAQQKAAAGGAATATASTASPGKKK